LFNHQLTDYQSFEWVDSVSAFVQEEKGMLYYSGQNIVGLSNTDSQLNLKVFPNPFSNSISFSIDGIYDEIYMEILNIQGQRVISRDIRNHERLNTANLSSGIYYYKLQIDKEQYSGKIIKY